MKFHSMCRFRCADGYFTDDELHDTKAYLGCLRNGTWNVQVPNCVGEYFFFFSPFPCSGFLRSTLGERPLNSMRNSILITSQLGQRL